MNLLMHLIQGYNIFYIFLGISGIGFLIGFHEFGHFIFCKIFRIGTPTFSIGMGPKIFSKKIGDTEFTLSAIPLGGYVEIQGQEEGETTKNPEYSFDKKPYYQKMLVISGGILFNILFSYMALAFLYYTGMPKAFPLYPNNASTKISGITPNSPAATAGCLIEDQIIAIDSLSVKNNTPLLLDFIKNNPNKKVALTILRTEEEKKLEVTLGQHSTNNNNVIGYLGVDFVIPQYSLIDSIKLGIKGTHAIIMHTFIAFKEIFTKKNTAQLGGPIMVISQTVTGASKGIKIFLFLLALISINLAVLNVIPVPIMDGGQALFYTIEAILRRQLNAKMKLYIHYACWFSFMLLAVFLTIKDVLKIFWNH